jgi:hypothetical protein
MEHATAPTRRVTAARTVRLGIAIVGAATIVALTAVPASARTIRSACTVAPTANGRYVAFLYGEILGRCPDAAAAQFWTARLDGGATRWSVAEALDTSTENLGRNNVDGLYQGLLGRAPTAGERSHWIDFLRKAHANAVPTAALLASEEGYRLHTSAATTAKRDEEWLAYAYNRILDRAPDPQGAAHYLRKFGSKGSTSATRNAVAMSLELSSSNARSWVRAAMTEALGRTPDAAGVRYWTGWLTGRGGWRTFQLWTHLLSSDEAYRRAQA